MALLCVVLIGLSGCFGYNRSAKRWAYVGDVVLVAGGGGMIAWGTQSSTTDMCGSSPGCTNYNPVKGEYIAGAVLIVAGIVGIVVNATRPTLKMSR